jgi:nicotinamidase-related amidase
MPTFETSAIRSPELASRFRSRLLVVDVQQRLMPQIFDGPRVITRCKLLADAARLMKIPLTGTEQYPQGLGGIVPELVSAVPDRIAKTRFSCVESLRWPTADEAPDGRTQVIVCGVEAHICVLQTALDLVSLGYHVYVPVDATSSRRDMDSQYAVRRMAAAGVVTCTTESIVFEWCDTASSSEFKQLSTMVKPL